MPVVDDTPLGLRPFLFHGVEASLHNGLIQAVGECPFCGKVDKLYVNSQTGQWDCKPCGESGNSVGFLRRLYEVSQEDTKADSLGQLSALQALAQDRSLLSPTTLASWGVVVSSISGDILIPGYGAGAKLDQLYRYTKLSTKGGHQRTALLPTPKNGEGVGFIEGPGLFGVNLLNPKADVVYICEGPWDGMALWEILGLTKRIGREDESLPSSLSLASSRDESLLATSAVVATPSVNIWNDRWSALLAGKRVVFLFDNDHPKRLCGGCKGSYSIVRYEQCPKCSSREGRVVDPAGWAGMRRLAQRLAAYEQPPKSIEVVSWGEGDHNPTLSDGYDVRDCLTSPSGAQTVRGRITALSALLSLVGPIPGDWVTGRTEEASKSGGTALELLPCESWKVLTDAWRKAMKWIEGLDRSLAAMLASIASVTLMGDQLWLMIVGPPSCGKSTICEAVSSNSQYVFAKSTIRGFHSGFQTDREGSADHSLVARLNGKALVTKDGDTLLSSPNLPMILSEGRDLYDTVSRTHYRNSTSRDYTGVRMAWILCGTDSLRQLDSSELGERFLSCVIMDKIDPDLERIISRRAQSAVIANRAREVGKQLDTHQDPKKTLAMQLTGGYINYLRANAARLADEVLVADETAETILDYAEVVSYMRARPSKKQEENETRELSARLGVQLTRLAIFLAVVTNRNEVDDFVLGWTRRIALDTARGRTMEMARHLAASGTIGLELATLAGHLREAEDKVRPLLRFLSRIGAVEYYHPATKIKSRPRWRLTERLLGLYETVAVVRVEVELPEEDEEGEVGASQAHLAAQEVEDDSEG